MQYVLYLRRWPNINHSHPISPSEHERHWPNNGLMSVHSLRRWPNIKPLLGKCVVFSGRGRAGLCCSSDVHCEHACIRSTLGQWLASAIIGPIYPANTWHLSKAGLSLILAQRRWRWTNIEPALNQCLCLWVGLLCLPNTNNHRSKV